MKKIITICVLIITSFQLSHSQSNNTLETYQLRGTVQSAKIERFRVDTSLGKPNAGERFVSDYMYADFDLFFNPEGKLTKLIVLQNEEVRRTFIYTYNTQGQIISVDGTGSGYVNEKFEYDSSKLIKHTSKRVNRNPFYSFYTYDDAGNNIEKIVLDWSKDTTDVFKYTYNEKGEVLTEKNFRNGKPYLHQYTWEYNDDGIKVMEIDSFGVPYKKYLIYNEFGDLITERKIDSLRTEITEYSFVYDDKNNWIEEIVFLDGKPLYIRKRTIVYY